jgi:hypothetical protein
MPAADVAANLGSLGAAQRGYFGAAVVHEVPGALAGSTDTAVSFDATAGTVVSVPYTPAMNPSKAFTVEAWLNPGAENPAGTLTCALSIGHFADPRSGWLIYQSDTGWNLRTYNQNSTATSVNITGGPAPVAGVWTHVVAVYDGTNAYVFVNGVQAVSGVPTGYVPGTDGPFFIGGRSDSSFWWNGAADEVAFYDKALTASVISSHYQNGLNASRTTPYEQLVIASAPLAYYRLNEPVYTPPATLPVAANLGSAGTANNGSYNPGVDASVAGPVAPAYKGFEADNTAVEFNGNLGFVGTPATLNDLTAFTIMGWIKRGAIHSGRGGYFGQNDLIEFGDADGGVNIEAWINAFGTNIKIPFPFRDNDWGLIALVGTTSKVTLYTNGLPAASITRSTPVDGFGTSTYFFNIGGGGVFNAAGDYFLGSIDEVAMFNKALTDAQVSEIFYGAGIAPSITSQPVAPARDLYEGNPVTLTVGVVGTPPISFQWRKGGVNLPGKTDSSLVFNSITVGDAGAYDVVASSTYGSATSSVVNLTVRPADTTVPVLQYATGNRNFNGVRVWFSEPVDPATAQTASNYQLSGGVTVTSATLAAPAGTPGDNMVDLVTTAQTPGQTYTLTVNNVKDQSSPGNAVAAGSTVTFGSWTLYTGALRFEHYDNIPGAADSDIDVGLADPRVIAGTPTTDGYILGSFDTRSVFPDDTHENYMARITGWLVPTETSEYYFFIRSDDASRFYLSTTEAIPNPSTEGPLITEPDCCDGFYEIDSGDPATTATPVYLEAGKRYGILTLLKEGGGGDWLMVAWRNTNDLTAAANLPALPGMYFAAYADPNADLQFTKQPTDQPGVVPTPVVDFVTLDFALNDGGFTVQNTDTPPPGPFVYSATVGWSADGGESACSGPYNSKLISPNFTVPQTEEVTLTFDHRYSFEAGLWDGGQVQISVNGGPFTPVPPENFVQNGYAPGKIIGTGVLLGQQAFNGDSAGYASGQFITSSVILGAFNKNDTIRVQFVGAWDDCTTASVPGWVIKKFNLAYGKAPRASTFTAEGTASRQGQAVPFSYQWQRNTGSGWVDVPNATTSSYRFFPTATDFTSTFRVLLKVAGKDQPSNVVKLTTGEPPTLSIAKSGAGVTITYTGTLQSATTVNGTYENVQGAQSPYQVPNPTGSVFFRSVK